MTHLLKSILKVIFFILSLSELSWGLCTLVKVSSVDPKIGSKYFGNGLAIGDHLIAANDHTLAPDAVSVLLSYEVNGSKKMQEASIIHRDFHTDLAVLSVPEKVEVCRFGSYNGKSEIKILTTEHEDQRISEIPVAIKNARSKKLDVPGISAALEVIARNGGSLPLRKSQSGGALFSDEQVVGILTEETPEGTGLAIPSEKILEISKKILEGTLPKRKYSFDYRKNQVEFHGLIFKRDEQNKSNTGGNPHESGGNPHESGGNKPIGLEDFDLGFAVAQVGDLAQVKQYFPEIAELLEQSHTRRVFIGSIDGQRVRSLKDFLQALEICVLCRVDNFWIDSERPSELSDSSLRAMAYLSQLVEALSKEVPMSKVKELQETTLAKLNTLLLESSRLRKAGLRSGKVEGKIAVQLDQLNEEISNYWVSLGVLEIIKNIRIELQFSL